MVLFPAMKGAALLVLAISLTACNSGTESLKSNRMVRVPVATRDLTKGIVIQASDISFAQMSESDAPAESTIATDFVGRRTSMPIPKGAFVFASSIDSSSDHN